MKWYVKCKTEDVLPTIHKTHQEAIEMLRSKVGEDYYLDVEFENTEEFIKWMNKEFFNPYDHGYYCKIHRIDDDAYWSKYLRPLGAKIAYALVKGTNDYCFDTYNIYAQYIDADEYFLSFDDMEDYFTNVLPLADILRELQCRC